MKELANEIVEWLKDYAEKSGRKSWVVGVSGGVDSALVSTLCAMTKLPLHCVILPCQTTDDQTKRGEDHIIWLRDKFGIENVSWHSVDLTDTFKAFYNETVVDYNNELAYVNTKSRLRMLTLYQIATCYSGLVVGTGNKVEDYGVGFFTKYGDGGVDISPIADLLKSEVREMCRVLRILPELCEAVATDGLWGDTRTDESQLGATYDELEWAMAYVDSDKSKLDELSLTERQRCVLDIYTKWHNAGKHKLAPIPTFKKSS